MTSRLPVVRAAGFWIVVGAVLFLTLPSTVGPARVGREVAAALPSGCNLYASPRGTDSLRHRRHRHRRGRIHLGSRANPFATPQKLMDSLRPGQTGCLRGGTYHVWREVRVNHGGRIGAPITLKSYPGERATLTGGPFYVPAGSNDVTVENLNIDTSATTEVGIQIMSHRVSLIGSDVTNRHAHDSCIIVGSNLGYGQAADIVIVRNVIHECGNAADHNEDHAIYLDNVRGGLIAYNVIWGAATFAVQLYQDPIGVVVAHNVMDDNAYGVTFAGSSRLASAHDVVANNIITNTITGYDVESYWGGSVGMYNVLQSNCVFSPRGRTIERPTIGFTALGNVTANPRYVDAAKHDYALRPGSPCVRVVGGDMVRSVFGH